MTRNELKIQLQNLGISPENLANEYGRTSTFVTRFFQGKSNSKPFEAFVLRKLGLAN